MVDVTCFMILMGPRSKGHPAKCLGGGPQAAAGQTAVANKQRLAGSRSITSNKC